MARKKSGGAAAESRSGAGGAEAARAKLAAALEKDGMKLAEVPEDERDAELCAAAVRQNWLALQYVPEKARDMYLCQKALRSDGRALEFVPAALRSGSLCRIGLRVDGLALEFVPAELRDLEVCRTAVQQNSSALRFVPAELLDRGFCLEAVRKGGEALEFVPLALRDRELCYMAVRSSARALRFVPEAVREPLMTVRALFSADAEARRNTVITCQAPPDWEEIKKNKPRDEWKRFENWTAARPEGSSFPEELALDAEQVKQVLLDLARSFTKAAGQPDFLDKADHKAPGSSGWLEAKAGEEGPVFKVYAAALARLGAEEFDSRGVPAGAGAFMAAQALMDWAFGWTEQA